MTLELSASALGQSSDRATVPSHRPLSRVLREVAEDTSREFIAINDLIATLGGRGRAGLLLLFAFPNILPAPPGMSGFLSLPLLYLSVQMMLGRVPWLPKFIGKRALSRGRFLQLIESLAPWLSRAERLLRPRWGLLVDHHSERLIGAFCLVLSIVLALPIPFGNMLPALAICLIALGILERDGVWASLGIATGIASLFVVGGVVYTLMLSTIFLMSNVFS